MNILFLVPYTPDQIRTRPYNFIKGLAARGNALTVATLWETEEQRLFLNRLRDRGIRVIAFSLKPLRKIINLFAALPSGSPLQANYAWHPGLAGAIDIAIRSTSPSPDTAPSSIYDVIHIEHLRAVRYGLSILNASQQANKTSAPPGKAPIPLVWDSVDCISHLFEQTSQNTRSLTGKLFSKVDLTRTRRFEAWVPWRFERVLVTSQQDKQAFERLSARTDAAPSQPTEKVSKITVLKNGVDLDYFTPQPELSRQEDVLVVSGKMNYHANVSMVLYLVSEIMPRVWEQQPQIHLWVVGKNPAREIKALVDHPNVLITGSVPDMRPYLRRAALAVAPIIYGAGIQNKVLEAMACGTAVLSSAQAVSALDAVPGRDLLVANDADAFARQILHILGHRQEREKIGQAGRRYVEAHHRWDNVVARLEGVYHEVSYHSNGNISQN